MRNEKKPASATPKRPFRRTDSDIRINMGGGSLVSDDLKLNEEQADRAVQELLAKARRAMAAPTVAEGHYRAKGA